MTAIGSRWSAACPDPMHRFFVPPECIAGDAVTLPGDVSHKLRRVLRARAGDEIVVLDDTGMEYLVRLEDVETYGVSGAVIRRYANKTGPSVAITLYQCILKADRFEYVLQKGTEIGITSFVPVICQRTVATNRPSPARYKRWRQIITEAAEQSHRGRIRVLREAMDFDSCCTQAEGTSLIPWEDGSAAGLKSRLGVWTSGEAALPSVNIFIGPEGGFTGDEVDMAGANGLTPFTLGKRILRAETPGLVVASAILYELGELGG